MEGRTPPPQWIPKGVAKSLSNGSTCSWKSHKSISVIGALPFGTLSICNPDELPVEKMNLREDDDEDAPPPLGYPVGGNEVGSSISSGTATTHTSSSSTPTRRRLTHNLGGGDVVLFLGLPEEFMVGCDSISFVAKHFGGMRDVPPGAHFFWVAHPGGLSTRSGVWVVSTSVNTVHVIQWDSFNEVLGEPTRAEARHQAEDLDEIHEKLVSYRNPTATNSSDGEPQEDVYEKNSAIWEQLTGFISESVLQRLTGQQLDNWFVHTGDRVRGSILMAAEITLDNSMRNSIFTTRELNFSFSQQSRTFSTEHIGADRTLEATDSTPYLFSVLDSSNKGLTSQDIVGEFQFAYLVGMHLGNDSCIQQWWHMILKLILRAYILPVRDPTLATDFVRTITAQLRYSSSWLEGSILDYSDSQTQALRLALTVYKRRLDELLEIYSTSDHLALTNAFSGLEAFVLEDLGWDLRAQYLRRGKVMMEDGEEVELEVADLEDEDERGEFAPEVVELDEEGRDRGLISWSD